MREADDLPFPDIPLPPEPWRYTRRLIDALEVAALMHAGQVRKSTQVPYLTHLLGACSIVLDHGATEDEAIAALLHDAIEDVEPREAARAAVDRFGPEVRRIVEACSQIDTEPKPSWRERRERYIRHLADADRPVLLVSASDKLNNARAIVGDLRTIGAEVWSRFSVPRDETLWYYRSLVTAFRTNPAHVPALINELERTVVDMERLAAKTP
jgi:GTP pyrophosphokinase